jgi:hypothetical protein
VAGVHYWVHSGLKKAWLLVHLKYHYTAEGNKKTTSLPPYRTDIAF